jgi:UDP-N-acetyl-D-galactosamine dehydrogenase
LIRTGSPVKAAKVIVLGITFKENYPDLRNSKVADLVHELRDFGCEVSVHDPVAIPEDAQHEYGIALTAWEDLPQADALVVAVAHRHYLAMPHNELLEKLKPGGVFVDVKSAHDASAITAAGYQLWRL